MSANRDAATLSWRSWASGLARSWQGMRAEPSPQVGTVISLQLLALTLDVNWPTGNKSVSVRQHQFCWNGKKKLGSHGNGKGTTVWILCNTNLVSDPSHLIVATLPSSTCCCGCNSSNLYKPHEKNDFKVMAFHCSVETQEYRGSQDSSEKWLLLSYALSLIKVSSMSSEVQCKNHRIIES